MSWKVLTDKSILERLRNVPVVGMRTVALDGKIDLHALARGDYAAAVRGAAHRLLIRLYDVVPCVVLVEDEATADKVGAFVWTGPGRITSSRDDEVVELADMLADEFGSRTPGEAV